LPEIVPKLAKSGEMSRGFRPKSKPSDAERPRLKELLNLAHPLVKPSEALDWVVYFLSHLQIPKHKYPEHKYPEHK
jgi:hypothetical protein